MQLEEFWIWFREYHRQPWGMADLVITAIGKAQAEAEATKSSRMLRGSAAIGLMKSLSRTEAA